MSFAVCGDHPEILNEPSQFLRDAGLDVVVEYRYGDVSENILEYQREHDIKLVVMGHLATVKFTSSFGKHYHHHIQEFYSTTLGC